MKLFVTGATGFIGSQFVQKATNNGHRVIAQVRPNSTNNKHPLVEKWVDKPLDGNFSSELKECDALVHFASHTPNPPYASLSECTYWNVTATLSLLEQAASAGLTKIVIAGSCFEYGSSANEFRQIPPSAPLKPLLSYPISKAAASIAACGLAKDKHLDLQILRIFQAFGEGEKESRFWPSLKRAALSGDDFNMSSGMQIRDFINVSDICDEFLIALECKTSKLGQPSIRNIGTGQGTRLIEFAKYWWATWGATGNLIPGAVALRDAELTEIVADTTTVYFA